MGGSIDQDAIAYLFVYWSFNDGWFYDSEGKVTKYTTQFLANPEKGDHRYFENGYLFK